MRIVIRSCKGAPIMKIKSKNYIGKPALAPSGILRSGDGPGSLREAKHDKQKGNTSIGKRVIHSLEKGVQGERDFYFFKKNLAIT